MTPKAAISSSYAVFSFVLDPARGTTIPIGIALWSPQRRWVKVRFLEESEQLTGFKKADHFPLARLARQKVESWLATGELPYAEGPIPPFEDRWWRHVKELLIHRVRLSEPRPIDCRDPDQELGPLYEAVVAPHRPSKERRSRIDGEIRRCLGYLAERFQARAGLPGFGGREVKVLRAYRGRKGWVVIEGVNLATDQADTESDAAVGKLRRLREGIRDRCEFLVGYLAPPEGLNGNEVLLEWIRSQTQAQTFDLARDRSAFLQTADKLVAQADGQELLR
jgi:hypothetical protein